MTSEDTMVTVKLWTPIMLMPIHISRTRTCVMCMEDIASRDSASIVFLLPLRVIQNPPGNQLSEDIGFGAYTDSISAPPDCAWVNENTPGMTYSTVDILTLVSCPTCFTRLSRLGQAFGKLADPIPLIVFHRMITHHRVD